MSLPTQDDAIEITFREATPPADPIILLAQKLETMAYGLPTAVIFSYATELPKEFDLANPPPGIEPNSFQAGLLNRFYNFQTKRVCPVAEAGPNGQMTRCARTSLGFRDILDHQYECHGRKCHYLCVLENCFAPFDKHSNAKRHFAAMHSRQAIERRRARMRAQEEAAAGRIAGPQRVFMTIAKRSLRSGLRNSLPTLSLRSIVTEDNDEGQIRIRISPDGSSTVDIARFHEENIRNGSLVGECHSQEQREWVAATGLLDIFYEQREIEYEFTQER